jgi:hypothetical protein
LRCKARYARYARKNGTAGLAVRVAREQLEETAGEKRGASMQFSFSRLSSYVELHITRNKRKKEGQRDRLKGGKSETLKPEILPAKHAKQAKEGRAKRQVERRKN